MSEENDSERKNHGRVDEERRIKKVVHQNLYKGTPDYIPTYLSIYIYNYITYISQTEEKKLHIDTCRKFGTERENGETWCGCGPVRRVFRTHTGGNHIVDLV